MSHFGHIFFKLAPLQKNGNFVKETDTSGFFVVQVIYTVPPVLSKRQGEIAKLLA